MNFIFELRNSPRSISVFDARKNLTFYMTFDKRVSALFGPLSKEETEEQSSVSLEDILNASSEEQEEDDEE